MRAKFLSASSRTPSASGEQCQKSAWRVVHSGRHRSGSKSASARRPASSSRPARISASMAAVPVVAKYSSNHRAKIARSSAVVGQRQFQARSKLTATSGMGRHVQYRALTVRWQGQQKRARAGRRSWVYSLQRETIFNIWFGPEKNGIPAKGRDEVNPLKSVWRPADADAWSP